MIKKSQYDPLNTALEKLLSGQLDKAIYKLDPGTVNSEDYSRLLENFKKLLTKFEEGYSFISALADGRFDTAPPRNNKIVEPLKKLQSSIVNLIQQLDGAVSENQNKSFRFPSKFDDWFENLISSMKERKLLEQALKESEARYRSLFTKIQEAFALNEMIFDDGGNPTDFRYLEVNLEFEKLSGMKKEQLIGKTIREIFPEMADKWVNTYTELFQDKSNGHYEDFSSETGRHFNIIAFKTDHNKFATILTDVTEHKEMERKIGLLASTVKSISECVSITDMEDKFIFINEAFKKLYGYEEHEILGKHVSVLRVDKPDPRSENKILPATLEGGWDGEIWNKSKDGREFIVHLSTAIINDDTGNPLALVGIATEITAKKLAEEQVKQTVALLKATLESTVEGILVVNNDGKIVVHNEQFKEIWKIPDDTLEFGADTKSLMTVMSKLVEKEKFMKQLEDLYSGKESRSYDTIELVDGRILERYSQPHVVDGKTEGRVWSFRDVTDKKRDEEKIKKINEELKDSNAAKDRFFSIIAHDLKSPFQALMGYSDLLFGEYYNLSEKEKKYFIDNIGQMSRNIYQLLENLLEWSRMQTGKILYYPDVFNLMQELHPTISLMKPSALNKNITLQIDIDKIIFVKADRNFLKTIVRNLISNAIKFTQPGGTVLVTAKQKIEFVEVSVSDSGIGMDRTELENIFNSEKRQSNKGTLNEDGTGLGLMLCKELVQLYEGRIWVESEVGEGTKFTFTIPNGI